MTSSPIRQLYWSVFACLGLGLCVGAYYLMPTKITLVTCFGVLLTTTVLAFARSPQNLLDSLASLTETARVGVVLCTRNGKVIEANQGLASMLEVPCEDITGLAMQEVLGSEFWEVLQANQIALASGDTLSAEFEVEVNGTTRSLVGLAQRVKQPFRRRLLLIQILDHSNEANARQTVLMANDQMRRILSSSNDMVFIIDTKLKVNFINETACQRLETSPSIITDQPFYQFISTEHRKACMTALERLTNQNRNEISLETITLLGLKPINVRLRIVRLATMHGRSFALICRPDQSLMEAESERSALARFSEVFHGSPDAILIMRAHDGLIVDSNEGFTRLLGYAREDIIGETGVDTHFWPNSRERAEVAENLRERQEVIDYETTLRTKNGARVHVEISLRYITVDGELCILCIGRDVTKRISAEAVLFETEEKFEKVFTQSPDGIVIIRRADGIIADTNDAFVIASGYDREELVGNNFMTFLDTSNQESIAEFSRDLASERTLVNHFLYLTTKQGKDVPSLISATVLELNGESHLMVIAKDISKLRSTEERLRRSEERFRGIFENAPIGILLVNMDGRVLQANHTAASMLAYEEAQMKDIHISRLVPNSERLDLKNALSKLVNGEQTTHQSERRFACQDSLELWCNVNIVLQKDAHDDPLYFIVQIADISDIKRGQAEMERLAFYDTLTNLANRRLFQDRLDQTVEQCQRYGRSAALLYLDLDNFKRINDTLGHEMGDALLREVASRISNCVRKEDTVSRPGGDEFTVLLKEVATPTDAGNVAEKILRELREPIKVQGYPLIITTSIGITVFPGDGADSNLLLRNADLAMYKAKERGRNNYQYYSSDLNVSAAKRLRTEFEIRQALEKHEFELYFQPKVSLADHQIVGVETLIRWNHPERGLLTPDHFIGIAEETGSIIEIGTWVIEEASRACNAIKQETGREIDVAINISPRQFRDPELVSTMRRSIREQGLDPRLMEVEITETMLMEDVAAAEVTVRRLSELGVKLAIDDFGTGYSSLNYLRRFPINTVKIDRSFVMDLPGNTDDLAITKAVIAMAHQLKMQVVAEGVETRAQMEVLAAEHCEYAQGYLFSKAIRLDDVISLLKNNLAVIHKS